MKKFSFLLSLAILAFAGFVQWNRSRMATPPPLSELTSFSLVRENGKKVTEADFKNTVWIVNFFFTSCQGPCPMQSQKMAKFQGIFRDEPEIRLASFSVDPERDTPDVMKEYGGRFHADEQKWWFLTGELTQVHHVLSQVFKVPAGEVPDLHSLRLVLMDKAGYIRGYFDSESPEDMDRLEEQARHLLNDSNS